MSHKKRDHRMLITQDNRRLPSRQVDRSEGVTHMESKMVHSCLLGFTAFQVSLWGFRNRCHLSVALTYGMICAIAVHSKIWRKSRLFGIETGSKAEPLGVSDNEL